MNYNKYLLFIIFSLLLISSTSAIKTLDRSLQLNYGLQSSDLNKNVIADDGINRVSTPLIINCGYYGTTDPQIICTGTITVQDLNHDSLTCVDPDSFYLVDDETGTEIVPTFNFGISNQTIDETFYNYMDSDNKYCTIGDMREISFSFPSTKLIGKYNLYVNIQDQIYYFDPYWDTIGTSFNNGTYINTSLVASFVTLNSSFTSGTYTSPVFDTNGSSNFSSITWYTNYPYNHGLPNNRSAGTSYVLNNVNMSGNVLLIHFDNDASVGENTTNFHDYSGSNNNLTCVGTNCPTSDTYALLNKSENFNGGNKQYIKTTLYPTLQGTISIWFSGTIGSSKYYIGAANDSLNADRCFLGSQSGFLVGAIGSRSTTTIRGTSNLSMLNNTWFNGVLTWDGTTVKLYLNGIAEYSGVQVGNVTLVNPFFIGTTNEGNNTPYNGAYITGNLDEVAVWNRSLSQTEVNTIYRLGATKLNLSVRSCALSNCSDGNYTDSFSSQSLILSIPNNKYFQYQYNFNSLYQNVSVELFNVSVLYNTTSNFSINMTPNITNIYPTNGSTITQINNSIFNITFNCSVSNLYLPANVKLYLNNTLNQTQTGTINGSYYFNVSLPVGSFNYMCGACSNNTICANSTPFNFITYNNVTNGSNVTNNPPLAFSLLYPTESLTVTNTTINLQWNQSLNATYYLVYADKIDGTTIVSNTTLLNYNYTLTNLTNGINEYYWKVISFNQYGNYTTSRQEFYYIVTNGTSGGGLTDNQSQQLNTTYTLVQQLQGDNKMIGILIGVISISIIFFLVSFLLGTEHEFIKVLFMFFGFMTITLIPTLLIGQYPELGTNANIIWLLNICLWSFRILFIYMLLHWFFVNMILKSEMVKRWIGHM